MKLRKDCAARTVLSACGGPISESARKVSGIPDRHAGAPMNTGKKYVPCILKYV